METSLFRQFAPEVVPTALGGDGVEGERGRAAVLLLECVKAERANHAEEGGVEVAGDGRRDGLLEGGVAGLEHRPGALDQALAQRYSSAARLRSSWAYGDGAWTSTKGTGADGAAGCSDGRTGAAPSGRGRRAAPG